MIGGAIANTFLATSCDIGKSLYENNKIEIAKEILKNAERNCQLVLPDDVVVAQDINQKDTIKTVKVNNIEDDYSV